MVEFCPECSNLLRKRIDKDNSFLVCKCGYQKEILPDNSKIETHVQKKKTALENNLVIVSEEDKISVYPKTKKDCPKCINKEAETWQIQMRSADEPSTHFFRCTECKHTWREY
ncbi:MAG: transcription factor S [Candidatus Lokiarchaeota archaeon]|nr:transcription factor S [Candidatus Lokiarchaeota archaeon]